MPACLHEDFLLGNRARTASCAMWSHNPLTSTQCCSWTGEMITHRGTPTCANRTRRAALRQQLLRSHVAASYIDRDQVQGLPSEAASNAWLGCCLVGVQLQLLCHPAHSDLCWCVICLPAGAADVPVCNALLANVCVSGGDVAGGKASSALPRAEAPPGAPHGAPRHQGHKGD